MEAGRRKAVRWVLLALLVALVAYGHWWYGNRHQFFDLGIYRQAVNWWLDGHDLYDFTKPDDTQGALGFTYPPFGALVLVPFGVLPWGGAVALYAVVTIGAVALTTWWLLAPVARDKAFAMILALTVISALEPIRETYTFGQINMVLVLLVLTDLLVLLPRGSKWAGVLVGLAAAIKLTPAIFIVYLLLSRRYRAGLTAIASAAGATLLTAAIAPRASWDFWTSALWKGEGLGNAAYTFNQSLFGMLARLDDPPNRIVWAALVLLMAGYGLWRARKAALAGNEVVGLTLAGIVGCLASPITWAHHLYWFVPALVVLWYAGRRQAAFAVLIAVTVGLGMVSWFEQGLPVHPWGDGVPGFLIKNWYLLLMIALLPLLPIRSADRDAQGQTPASEPATVR
ncbi:glycosyltransferase 87 family protein [Dactylosporangium sp. AC04546]|uniref:glycosyltransferase 87 family protein n=1 Tax=Dactylosporangium sp. AC04546 TaxID=2862460 RepID=UPI001EE0540D|nr:glycosyltransferase 87 family protein [Dactylosporangium sp. AC04546]WVK83858.1 glycosyltransferase 87 family protein [Dactylosporangium sp. AC04546]